MNAAQITHIFWKEYRTQRSIWLGITLIAVVIQGLVWAMMPSNARDPLATLASIGAILSVFYALASAGVLFAGEREEQTYSWLRILPVSSVSLFGGKLLWFVVSWLLAVGISLLTAYLPYWGTDLDSDKIRQGLTQFAAMGGGLALWGVFFSLLCQRVYTALALAPLALLLTAGLNSYFPGIAYVLYAAVAMGVVVQGRRWIVDENLAIWTGFGWRSRALTLDDVLVSAAEASPAWRFFRRELWLEWCNAWKIALGSCVLLTMTMSFLVASGIPDALPINWFLVFAILPLVYGVNTFRGEQYQSRYRFQSHVGVSPAGVWISKHLVWIGLLLLTMVASCVVVALPWLDQILSRTRSPWDDRLYQQLPIPTGAWPWFVEERFSQSWLSTVWLSVAMAVWMYAIGHVCSLLIKRSVSAALVAVALGTLACVPVAATLLLDVPRVIGILLPAVLLLLFSLWRTKGWLSERNEPRDWVRVFGVLATLGLVCMTSWVMWRMSELTMLPVVAGFVSFFPVAGLLQLSVFRGALVFGGVLLILLLLLPLFVCRRKLTFKRVFVGWSAVHILSGVAFVTAFDTEVRLTSQAEVSIPVPSEEALETGDLYRELNLLISSIMPQSEQDDDNRNGSGSIFEGTREVSEAQWAWLNHNEEALEELRSITNRPDCAPDKIISDWGSDELKPLLLGAQRSVDLLRLSALRSENAGDLEQAWSDHLTLLRMLRHFLLYQAPDERIHNIALINDYYQRDLKRWVNHPAQTSDLLVQAAEDFTGIIEASPRMEAAIDLRYHGQISALEQDRLGTWTHGALDVTDWPTFMFESLNDLPWESQRGSYMLNDVYQQQKSVADAIESGNSQVYGREIAAGTQWNISYYPVRAVWNWYENSPETEENVSRWRLAETTPLFRGYGIEGFGTAPSQNSWMWQRELNWVQHRRLVLIHTALRVAELENIPQEERGVMNFLAEARENPKVNQILTLGEELEGKLPHKDGPHAGDRIGFYFLYQNPISHRLFQSDQLRLLLQ